MTTLLLFLAGCLAVLGVGAFAAGHLVAGAGLGIATLLIVDWTKPEVLGQPRRRD